MSQDEKKPRKRPRGQGKGQAFEREVCKRLSLWWTYQARDDIFWRSSNSGGRATIRGQRGKGTFGQYGDIQATDPIGQPLMSLCTIECKRGAGATLLDVIENGRRRDKNTQPSPWEKYLRQVLADQERSGRPFWLLITKRNSFEPMIFMPLTFYAELVGVGAFLHKAFPRLLLTPRTHNQEIKIEIYGTQLAVFLRKCQPANILKVADVRKV